MNPTPSRNAPCPCGSGARYKDCHGALEPPARNIATAAPALGKENSAVASGADELLQRARVGLADGDAAGAAAACRQLLAQFDPNNAEAHFHLGNIARERGEHTLAISHYERALRHAPGHAGLLNNLGLAAEAGGDFERAEASYLTVLAVDAQHPDALANLGNVLYERERYGESAQIYDRAFALRSNLPVATWVRRAIAQDRARDFAGAIASFTEAARLAPDDLQIHISLIAQQMRAGHYAEAEPALQRALAIDPSNAYTLSMLAHAHQHRCVWDGLPDLFKRINEWIDRPADGDQSYAVNPFPLLAMPSSPRAQLIAAQRWAATVETLRDARKVTAHGSTSTASARADELNRRRTAAGRLRVGFVSADFREHPMAHLSMEFWERIDRDRFETFAYGLLPSDPGQIGRRIGNAFEHFVDVSAENSATAAQRVRADGIDVLIDLNGYTAAGDSELFSLRPAPLQINMIGFPGTLGADWYDYVLVDAFGAPLTMQPYYTERLWQMPHSSYPSDTTRAPQGPAPTRVECGLPEHAFVFCCFNKSFKILPDVYAVWMRLLKAIPGSVLWLLASSDEASDNLRREASAAGVDPQRLIFAPKVPLRVHLARHAAADLFLDSFPYGAHTTTNDALLVGLPVVTCAGETLVTRLAGSQLHAIGLPDLVTHTLAGYEALALALALDPAALAAIRARLAANRRTHPLFDMVRYTRDFEDGLGAIWRR